MNNEISNKSLSLSSVDASLAAIIPDTPIVSIAGSTLSEITTTTTSTTTTPIPTPTSYESNKVDISTFKGPLIKSMSGASPKLTGAATHCATASFGSTKATTDDTTTTSKDVKTAVTANLTSTPDTIISIEDNDIYTDTNSNASNLNLIPTNNAISASAVPTSLQLSPTTSTTKRQEIPSTTTVATSSSSSASTGNSKSEVSSVNDKKSKDSELREEKKVTDLDDQNLKLLLEEAYSYRSPTDKVNKSDLFLKLLQIAENEKEDTTLYHVTRLMRSSHSNHPQHQHRQKHGGSLQNLDEADRTDAILDNDYYYCGARGQRNRRPNHNSRQKKYPISVSSRQREGGSLPNNVNFTNCGRVIGVSGGGGCAIACDDFAGPSSQLEQQFMLELNTTSSGGNSACGVTVPGNISGISYNTFTNSNSSTKPQQQQQGRNTTGVRSNAMSTSSVTTTSPSVAGTAKTENEPLVGQPIKVVIGGQVTGSQVTTASIGTNINSSIDGVNACHNILNSAGGANSNNSNYDKNTLVAGTPKLMDVRQQAKISQAKSSEAIAQGHLYCDRLENVEIIPHSNMMSAVPSRTNFGPTTANAYIDEKIHFSSLRGYNASAVALASPGAKNSQIGPFDTKYLPLQDNYKSIKSVLAITDKDDGRGGEVDENGNAVTETFPVNSTHASVATATVNNPINATSASVTSGASANASGGGLSQTVTTKSKSKKQPKQERNVTTVDAASVAGYRGTDPVEKLVEYIESTTGGADDNKNSKQKKERKKQEKQEKHNKIKRSNSLEELRSCAKMEVDDLKRTAATTESNVMMRNKSKTGKNNSSSTADINKNFESGNGANGGATAKDKATNITATTTTATVAVTNRKGERRSWGTEELQYLGDANNASEEKVKEKERKNKNRDNQKDRAADDKDKSKVEKWEKMKTEVDTIVSTSTIDRHEKQPLQQIEKLEVTANIYNRQEKFDKRKKSEQQQQQQMVGQLPAKSSTAPSASLTGESSTVVDILAMDSLLPETAEFHVVTKKKKTKKQRLHLEEHNGNNHNNNNNHGMGNNKTHNFISNPTSLPSTLTLKTTAGGQQARFNAKFNSSDHSNNNNNNNTNNNYYQQHHNSHYHSQQQYQHQQNSDKSRRKSTSSVPPSEKSDSSDLDSVHSLPIERAAKSAGSTTNSKMTSKQIRQNKNTATGSNIAAMNFQPKSQQQHQQQPLPTPFSYAEIAKEAKGVTATITLPTVGTPNSNVTNDNSAPLTATAIDGTPTNIEDTKTTAPRNQYQQQQQQLHQASISATTSVTYSPPSTSSSSSNIATSVVTTSTSNSNSLLSNNSSTITNNKNNKTKKSTPKPDFPALSSASDVAVAASAERADIFAKAVLNSSQNTTSSGHQPQQQYYAQEKDSNESVTTPTSASKPSNNSNVDTSQKDFTTPQQQSVHHHHQLSTSQPFSQQTQQQQTLHKSKSVEHDTSTSSSSSNTSYSHPMDHHQYPALKTVKRHSASNFAPLSAVVSTSSTVGQTAPPPPQTQQHMQQFNFAAAARQMVTGAPTTTDAAATTTSNVTNTVSSTNLVSKAGGAGKEKNLSVNTTTPIATTSSSTDLGINRSKKNKKEKQPIMDIGGSDGAGGSKQTPTMARKSTAATQTNTAGLLNHNEGGKQQNNSSNNSSGSGTVKQQQQQHTRNNVSLTTNQTPGTAASTTLSSSTVNRPAVIILNDDSVGVSTDFTFGDFNEDELHFFDDDAEEYACAAGTAAAGDDIFTEHHTQSKLTSSSPRSGSVSTTSLQNLNDSGTCSDLGMVHNSTNNNNNVLVIQQNAVSPVTSADETISTGNADTTLSSNNSTLTENQHNSNSSGSGHSNHSVDSGIYTITSTKAQGAEVVSAVAGEATGVNAFLQQHISTTINENDAMAGGDKSDSSLSAHQPRQLETCNEIESVIIAAARRQQQQDQQHSYTQQKSNSNQQPTSTTTTAQHYQHSNSSSFSSSSSTDGGANRFYSTSQSPPPPPVANSQQQQSHYNNNRQGYHSYQQQQQPRALQQYYQNAYHLLPNHGQQQQQQHTTGGVVTTNSSNTNIYSRSNSECDDYVSPSPDTLTVKLQNKEYDLRYLPPANMATTNCSQNEFIVDYVASVWDEVVNSKSTRFYDGQ